MSGFSVSASLGAPPGPFLILFSWALAGRQSATAAANTAISAGSAFITAASMSCALATLMILMPGGSGRWTGPETSVTSAPAAAAAAAMEWPCLPEERCDVAHRIDRLMGWTGGDDYALTGERALACGTTNQRQHRRHDL